MGQFISEFKYTRISTRLIILRKPLRYKDSSGVIYEAPRGFKSDGMSIPRAFWWFKKPFSKGLRAGVIHDFILECPDIKMSFTEADNIFREALRAADVNYFTAKIMEWATDLNGIFVHRNKKPNNWDENQS